MKRILAFGLAFLLILGLLPASALADTASPAFVLAGGKAQQGDTVQVTLSTQNNTGIVSLKVMVEYDSNVLSLTSIEEKDFYGVSFGPLTKNPIAVNWMNSLEQGNTTNGVVAVLTFTVLDTAADGETAITATYNPNDVFDYDMNNVAFDVVNGTVTVGCVHKETTTVPAKASTCLTQGNGEYTYCNRCEQVLKGSNELFPLGDHDFTKENATEDYKVSDATCMDKALYHHSCILCGEEGETTFTVGDVDKNNHIGEEVLVGEKEPTYEEEGYTGDLCCDACGDVVKQGSAIDKLVKENGLVQDGDGYRYLIDGEAQSGWFEIEGQWYYFFEDTLAAKEGSYKVGVVTYEFEVTGKLVSGVWGKTLFGTRYYYGPDYYRNGWEEIDGNQYYFQNGYRYEGIRMVQDGTLRWFDFGTDGICSETLVADGFYTDTFGYGYSQNGVALVGTQCINDAYYYFNEQGYALKNGVYDGRLYQDEYTAYSGGLTKDGVDYLYKDGKAAPTGLYKIDSDYYYVGWDGSMRTNGRYYTDATFCDLPIGDYTFGADGKMLQGIVELDGVNYLYINGNTTAHGLFKVEDHYYFADWGGIIKTDGRYYVGVTYCDMPVGEYSFGVDGKLLDGVADINGVKYLYINGTTSSHGLFKVGNDYYFADWGGVIKADGRYYVGITYCDLPVGEYTFGADGKMLNGIVEIDGTKYLYINGTTSSHGLFKVDGDYYFADWGGVIRTNIRYYVGITYCDLPIGNYSFGTDGKMLNGVVEIDGTKYLYINGTTSSHGLFKVDGDYYFADWGGVIKTDGRYYVGITYCDLPIGEYTFGADGKMLNGIVEMDGTKYLYINGTTSSHGLFKVGGDYYFADWGGVIRTNIRYYVGVTYCDLPIGNYTFGADGKMLQGFVDDGDTTYYYVNGNNPAPGVIEVDGDYYFVNWGGVIVKNQTFYVFNGNGYTVEMTYTFDENGKIIG